MRFNIKLTEYVSNTATISIFDDMVGSEEGVKRKAPPADNKAFYNPFTGEYDYEADMMEDEVDAFLRNQKSLVSSVRRSKRKILRLMRSLDLSCAFFVTLTFDKAKVDRTDFDMCCKKCRIWLQNLRRNEGASNLSFVCTPELHSDMESWHLHAIICNPGKLPMNDSGHKDRNGHIIYNIPGWKYGFSTAVKLNGEDPMTSIKLSKYMTKYFTKESQMIAKNRHRYFSSKNIPCPKTTTWRYESEAALQSILSKIKNKGYTFVSKNTFDGYVKADYIEVIKT